MHQGARVVTLSFPKLIDLYHAREALEGMACRLAAERAPEATLQALSALLDEHEKGAALHAGAAYLQDEGDLDFHVASPRQAKTRRLSLFFATSFII